MENVNLCLKVYHLEPLIEAIHARSIVVTNDTNSTPAERAVIADLERRAVLLHDAIKAEDAAKEAREAYNRHVQRARYCNRHPDKSTEATVSEAVEGAQEQTSTAIPTKRPV